MRMLSLRSGMTERQRIVEDTVICPLMVDPELDAFCLVPRSCIH